jgi:predicted O-linked N-acetylglucosamine transferase (SPINDLY family)
MAAKKMTKPIAPRLPAAILNTFVASIEHLINDGELDLALDKVWMAIASQWQVRKRCLPLVSRILHIKAAQGGQNAESHYHVHRAFADLSAGNPESALNHALAAANAMPTNHEAYAIMGIVYEYQRRWAECRKAYYTAISLAGEQRAWLLSVGWTYFRQEFHTDSQRYFKRVMEMDEPLSKAQTLRLLASYGESLCFTLQPFKAARHLAAAVRIDPTIAFLHTLHAQALKERGAHGKALAALERARRLDPDQGHYDLVLLLLMNGRRAEAEEQLDRIATDDALLNKLEIIRLQYGLLDLNATDMATRLSRRLIERGRITWELHSLYVWLVDHFADTTTELQQSERRRWHDLHVKPLRLQPAPHPNRPDPERPLRIGLVSGEFQSSSASMTFWAFLERHDKSQFHVTCYSNAGAERTDQVTHQIHSLVGGWRDIHERDDDSVAAQIRADGIDILVDISGHSWQSHRLLMFARKPAPVQVTAWGYAAGSGLPEIDYLFSDRVLIPEEERPLYAETIWDLPAMIGYPCPGGSPEVVPPPSLASGFVTFGCFNAMEKMTPEVIAAWAEIMHAVPGSRIMLKYPRLDLLPRRPMLEAEFTRNGIDLSRLTIMGRTPWDHHVACYGDIDIALDPFPHGGGITTCDALWMGVPVVSLNGTSLPARNSASLLTTMGMTDWMVDSLDDYKALAIRRASDPAALAELRAGLRARMSHSPLGPVNYAGAIQDAFRAIWRRYCAKVAA